MNRYRIILAALAAASFCLLISSCSKYDDTVLKKKIEENAENIKKNTEAIEKNKQAISDLQNLIDKGALITSISTYTTENGGIIMTLNDGTTLTMKNGKNGKDGKDGKDGQDGKNGKDGKDGANGTVWEINKTDSLWYCNGFKTEYRALPIDGKNGENGQYYVPNENGYFDIYKNGVKTATTDIKWTSGLTAVLSGNKLIFSGVDGTEQNVVVSLGKGITSVKLYPGITSDDGYSPILKLGFGCCMVNYLISPSDAYWGRDYTVSVTDVITNTRAGEENNTATDIQVINNGWEFSNGILTVYFTATKGFNTIQYYMDEQHIRNMVAIKVNQGQNSTILSDFAAAEYAEDVNHSHEYVQLWDNGLKWATHNMDLGDRLHLFQTSVMTGDAQSYGSRAPYDSLSRNINTWGKYASSSKWRVPTRADYDSLLSKCDMAFRNNYVVFTSKSKEDSLCFPLAGMDDTGGSTTGAGTYGEYWLNDTGGDMVFINFNKSNDQVEYISKPKTNFGSMRLCFD